MTPPPRARRIPPTFAAETMHTLARWVFEFGGVTLLALALGLVFGYAIGRLHNPSPIRWLHEEEPDPLPLPRPANVIDLRAVRAA